MSGDGSVAILWTIPSADSSSKVLTERVVVLRDNKGEHKCIYCCKIYRLE